MLCVVSYCGACVQEDWKKTLSSCGQVVFVIGIELIGAWMDDNGHFSQYTVCTMWSSYRIGILDCNVSNCCQASPLHNKLSIPNGPLKNGQLYMLAHCTYWPTVHTGSLYFPPSPVQIGQLCILYWPTVHISTLYLLGHCAY